MARADEIRTPGRLRSQPDDDGEGFWLENNITVDDQFIAALAFALKRFTQLVGASAIDLSALSPPEVRETLQLRLNDSP